MNTEDNGEKSPASEMSSNAQLPRAYQIEMLEQSMKQNTIVTMATGTGKTSIAKLRIEAELLRSPFKMVWFTAPSVVLANRQHAFLSTQLPFYMFKLITGLDKVQLWNLSTWNAILEGTNVIVSTPQILLDALRNAFVYLKNISLLIFDEAHHCLANSPTAVIMRDFYHPMKSSTHDYPHVLGLTASPTKLEQLERNMDAICKAPTRQLVEYQQYAYLPRLIVCEFDSHVRMIPKGLDILNELRSDMKIEDDPSFQSLKLKTDLAAQEKVAKILKRGYTANMKQITSLYGHAIAIHEHLGPWAATMFLRKCLYKLKGSVSRRELLVEIGAPRDQHYLNDLLSPVYSAIEQSTEITCVSISDKARILIQWLTQEHHTGPVTMIFVKRRSMAFMLAELLRLQAELDSSRIFPFVGFSSYQGQSLADIADKTQQRAELSTFRLVSHDICVATQVFEEGIDIQAVNTVIRFDDPETFKSYIQSRGRARCPESKFVVFQNRDEAQKSKYTDWERLEIIMKQQYMDEVRALEEREAIEEQDESGDERYIVPTTGAILTYANARQKLQHFCTTVSMPADPIMLITGSIGDSIEAKAVLPCSLPPSLQTFSSSRAWKTERMAKKDAAFQACKKLHTQGLLTDNLVPPSKPKPEVGQIEGRDSLCNARPQINPWELVGDVSSSDLFNHSITVTYSDGVLLPMILALPFELDHQLKFDLCESHSARTRVEITPLGKMVKSESHLALTQNMTNTLLTTVYRQSVMRMTNEKGFELPFLFFPQLFETFLEPWYAKSTKREFLSNCTELPSHQPLLIWVEDKSKPVLWYPPHLIMSGEGGETITTTAIRRRQLYLKTLSPDQPEQNTKSQDVRALASCSIDGLTGIYGYFAFLLPSIISIFEAAMRAQLARKDVLSLAGFKHSRSLVSALIASSASDMINYERLEYVGDGILKFYAAAQVYHDFSMAPESDLTIKLDQIVSNGKLARSTSETGLDAYITTSFAQDKSVWAFPAKMSNSVNAHDSEYNSAQSSRRLSSKTIADIVESLIAAAWLDGRDEGESELRITSTLRVLLPEIVWIEPHIRITQFQETSELGPHLNNLLENAEQPLVVGLVSDMLEYQFANTALLLEALTQSSGLPGTCQSYQRLEFLGDAIIDRLVKQTLFEAPGELKPGQMHQCAAMLVSHDTLSFLAMNTSTKKKRNIAVAEKIDNQGNPLVIEEEVVIHLTDCIQALNGIPSSVEAIQRYEESRDEICRAFETNIHPFELLYRIGAPKVYSDIFESLIGAVFIDSGGSLEVCETILERLGLLKLVRRVYTTEGLESVHPPTQLKRVAPNAVTTFESKKDNAGRDLWSAKVRIEAHVLAEVESLPRQHWAEIQAARMAVERLELSKY